jgi:hypothetical protein
VTATPRGMATYMLGPAFLIALPADLCGGCHFGFWLAAAGFDDTRRIVIFKLWANPIDINSGACFSISHTCCSGCPKLRALIIIRASGSANTHLAWPVTLAACKCGKPSRWVPTAASALTLVEF